RGSGDVAARPRGGWRARPARLPPRDLRPDRSAGAAYRDPRSALGRERRPGPALMHEAANGERQALDGITFRRPTEADYTSIVRVIDDWWGAWDMQWLLPRLWLQHFSSTSWLAESEDGRLAGFLVGFLSQGPAGTAHCRLRAHTHDLRR